MAAKQSKKEKEMDTLWEVCAITEHHVEDFAAITQREDKQKLQG